MAYGRRSSGRSRSAGRVSRGYKRGRYAGGSRARKSTGRSGFSRQQTVRVVIESVPAQAGAVSPVMVTGATASRQKARF